MLSQGKELCTINSISSTTDINLYQQTWSTTSFSYDTQAAQTVGSMTGLLTSCGSAELQGGKLPPSVPRGITFLRPGFNPLMVFLSPLGFQFLLLRLASGSQTFGLPDVRHELLG
jgi:hypothetical protein